MTEPEKPAKQAKTAGRDARLAAALRENLRRRKAQERGRGGQAGPESADVPDKTPQAGKNR